MTVTALILVRLIPIAHQILQNTSIVICVTIYTVCRGVRFSKQTLPCHSTS